MSRLLVFLSVFFLWGAVISAEERRCVREIENTFFNSVFVSQALASHDVSQSAWSEVNRKLQARVDDLPRLVKERASSMHPNPFDSPFQPHEAAKVLQEVLYDLFASVLREFNVDNPFAVREMFNYIRQQQNRRFVDCFGIEESLK